MSVAPLAIADDPGGLLSAAAGSPEVLRVRADGFARTYSGPVGRIGKLVFERNADGWFVVDTGVQGGVFLDGCRMQRLPLYASRSIEVRVGAPDGHAVRFEVIRAASEPVRTTSKPALVADCVDVTTAEGRSLVRRASFELQAGQLVAVIGPSGAGKSTLLRALTGQQQAAAGRVTWRGVDLHADTESRRAHVGLVPQEEILHPQLTVRHSLEFAARLRLPAGTSADERHQTVERVIDQMDLAQRADVPVRNLSGGQRKRVSIATELLTAPPLLFLDEPTSGLDPGLDRAVMEQLRKLADDDRLVVVATHSVMGLDVCDSVVAVAKGGIVAYVGPPDGLLDYFGVDDHPALFDRLAAGRVEAVGGAPRHQRSRVGRLPILGRPSGATQLSTLVLRNLAVMLADRLNVAMLLVLPLVLAMLARVVQGDHGLSLDAGRTPKGLFDGAETGQRLAVLVIAAALLGVAMSVRELVKERAIWHREYAVGVSPGVYFASKVLVLLPIAFTQGAVVAWLAMLGLPGPDGNGLLDSGRVEIEFAIGLLAAVMAAGGLLVSAVVRSVDQVMPALVAVVMSQVVLSSALIHLEGRPVLDQLSWLAPGRWSFAAAAATTGLERAKAGVPGAVADVLAKATAGQWWLDLSVLALLGVGLIALGARAVRRNV